MSLAQQCVRGLDIVLPLRCALCGRHGAHICIHCRGHLARAALVYRPPLQQRLEVYALGAHDGPLRAAILALKFRNRTRAGFELGLVLGRKLPRCFDAIVPVPLHARRQSVRGRNQAETIAFGVASCLRVPVFCGALVRSRPTARQSSLALRDRARNVRGAFCAGAAADRLRGLRILLIDDVITTGATIAACAHALRSSGVACIAAASLALRR